MTTINATTVFPSLPTIANDPEVKTAPAPGIKQPLQAAALNASINAQVLSLMDQAKSLIETASPRQLQSYLDSSSFSEAESETMMNAFLAAVAIDQRTEDKAKEPEADPVSALLNFDPNSWEKHVGVLIAAIVAVNLARKASAEMSGKFAIMSFESAKAQGVAIVKGGEAAMYAAITAAAVSGAMSLAGGALQLKGQSQKLKDLTTNKRGAADLQMQIQADRAKLKTLSPQREAGGDRGIRVRNTAGDIEARQAPKGNGLPTQDERTKLQEAIDGAVGRAKELRMKSQENQKTIDRNLTVGGALSGVAMVLSTGIASMVRMMEYTERNNEVMRQGQSSIEKSMTDMANQNVGDDTALVAKLLEAFKQLLDGRNATNSAISSSRA
ncbi:hypothetical protein PS865_04438 [Pseudomonas fluorescens]|uniref:IpaC/SipC family type III secretion system effector n=1 Tax=Pseudomonas fluorescens TaxID=294 RepID=UPI00125BB594|nr:IpaC/SipC family type III secretion system effector [Pseudomonas fluorescens]VVP32546.1 hypothetical protein PS865_04438 [Pseudomonas fluorescens]